MNKKKTLPEELPRYVIDEGIQSEKDSKILSEEQEKALQKLMKAAGHALMEEERKLIYQLEDRLKRETERVKSLKKFTVRDKPLDTYLSEYNKKKQNNKVTTLAGEVQFDELDDGDSDEPRKVQTVKHIVGFKPEEVVRRYVECWNQQKFGAEYDCFSRDFISTDRESYINARHLYFQQQLNGGGLKIQFKSIDSVDDFGVEAEVIATKTIQHGNRKPVEETDRYKLKLEKGRWVISAVEPS